MVSIRDSKDQSALQIFDPKSNLWSLQYFDIFKTLDGPAKELPVYPIHALTTPDFPWIASNALSMHNITYLANDAARMREPIVLSDGQILTYEHDLMYNDYNGRFFLQGRGIELGFIEALYNILPLPDGRLFVCRSVSQEYWLIMEQIYDPKTDKWSTLKDPNEAIGQSATLLPDGKILFIGGAVDQGKGFIQSMADDIRSFIRHHFYPGLYTRTPTPLPNYRILDTCRIYDPITNIWRIVDRLNTPRAFHTANLLPDGRVLVTGGSVKPQAGAETNTCEIIAVKDIDK